tara:strand:- start:1365 stop:2204 length:840 start_codon:yes stop_codon:yes gene_type:complete
MATLTNQQIDLTYPGLIKLNNNTVLGAVEQSITDGVGNASTLNLGTTSASFIGTLDLTGATINGITPAGLEVGTGTNSLMNAVGGASISSGVNSVAIGNSTTASAESSISLGDRSTASGYGSFSAGLFAQATQFGGFALGQYAEASQSYASAFGPSAGAHAESGIAFGQQTSVPFGLNGAIAMGRQVTAVQADTTHVRELYIVAPDGAPLGGNGITMLSPNGTAQVVTAADSGTLEIDSRPVVVNDAATPTSVINVWSGTEAQYGALGAYDANTIYYTI